MILKLLVFPNAVFTYLLYLLVVLNYYELKFYTSVSFFSEKMKYHKLSKKILEAHSITAIIQQLLHEKHQENSDC